MATQRTTGISKVVSLRTAKNPIHNVSVYGAVRSFSYGERLTHGVVKVGRRFHCSCPDFLFRHTQRGTCKHVRAFKATRRQGAARTSDRSE